MSGALPPAPQEEPVDPTNPDAMLRQPSERLETKSLEVEAVPVMAREVEVALVVVEFKPVKFCKVEEAVARKFPAVTKPEKVAATILVSVVSRSRSSSVKVKLSPAVRLVSAEMSRPETSAVPTVAQVAAPNASSERTNWLVQEVPAYSAKTPSVPVKVRAEVREVAKKLVEVPPPETKRLPLTDNLSFGVVEPTPNLPLASMVNAAVVEVAKVDGEPVAM